MGNHFHLLVWMLPETDFSDRQIMQRYERFSGKDKGYLVIEAVDGMIF